MKKHLSFKGLFNSLMKEVAGWLSWFEGVLEILSKYSH
jgi:hypothetical protein